MREKYAPYILIAILAFVGVGVSYLMISQLPWYLYLLGFFARFLFMSLSWQIIILVNKGLEQKFSLEEHPGLQIFLQVLITLLIMSPLFALSYMAAGPYLPMLFSPRLLPVLTTVLYFMVTTMMTFGYYTFTLFIKHRDSFRERSRLELEAVQREREKSLMNYHHLKNQVNPHFLFNTLTSLEALIHTDPVLASAFVRHLAKVYRYVLQHKEKEVVSLETELNFIGHYISLLEIRYKEAFRIRTEISEEGKQKGIVMVTLQMLIDNAIKHNSMQPDHPLVILIRDEEDYLHIYNNRQIRKQMEPSNGQGLIQLKELYTFLSDRQMEVLEKTDSFEVILPLL